MKDTIFGQNAMAAFLAVKHQGSISMFGDAILNKITAEIQYPEAIRLVGGNISMTGTAEGVAPTIRALQMHQVQLVAEPDVVRPDIMDLDVVSGSDGLINRVVDVLGTKGKTFNLFIVTDNHLGRLQDAANVLAEQVKTNTQLQANGFGNNTKILTVLAASNDAFDAEFEDARQYIQAHPMEKIIVVIQGLSSGSNIARASQDLGARGLIVKMNPAPINEVGQTAQRLGIVDTVQGRMKGWAAHWVDIQDVMITDEERQSIGKAQTQQQRAEALIAVEQRMVADLNQRNVAQLATQGSISQQQAAQYAQEIEAEFSWFYPALASSGMADRSPPITTVTQFAQNLQQTFATPLLPSINALLPPDSPAVTTGQLNANDQIFAQLALRLSNLAGEDRSDADRALRALGFQIPATPEEAIQTTQALIETGTLPLSGHTVANRVNHLLTLGRALEQFGPHLRQPVTPSEAKELLRAAENAALPQALHGLVNPRTPNDLARLPFTEPNLLQRLGTPFADASRAVLGGVSHPRQSARQIYGFRHTIQSVIDTWQYQRLQPKTQDIDRLAVRLGIPPENRAAALPQLIRILRPSLSPEQVQQISSQLEALQTFPAARNRVMISEFIGTATGQRPFFLQLMNDPRRWTNVVQEVQKGMKQDVPTPKVFQVAGAIYASRMSPSIPQRMDFSRFGHSFFSGIFGRFNSPLAQRLLTSVSMSVTAPITLPITLVWQTVSLVRSGFGEIRQWGSLTNGQRAGAVLKLTAGLALPVSAFLILPAISTAVVTTTVGALGISAIHPIAWMLGSTVTSLGVSSAVGNVLINAAAHLTPLALTTAINRLNGNATSVPTLQQKAIGTIRQFDQVITGPLRDQPEVASAYDAVARLHALSA
ncbi:MAG: hypothetical protein HYT88_01820, partial [Candidatus Omnitrophica bacterium]|nr:hypothetical protein [Candidatus Omnitrophota bacterium]